MSRDPANEVRTTARPSSPAVPPDVSARIRETYRERLPIVAATLVGDTRTGGERTGDAGLAWTMSYETGRCALAVDVAPTAGRRRVTGQLLCPDQEPGTVVRAYRLDEIVAAASTDAAGRFDLSVLYPDVFTVAVITSHEIVELIADLRPDG